MLVALVPHADVEEASGDESTVHGADKETDDKEPGEVLGDARKNTRDTPNEGESGQPKPWGCEFEYDVARDLEQDVGDQIDG